ncbi:MAG: hypothetical protein AAGF07_02365 [Patescibacteria group bacterium]
MSLDNYRHTIITKPVYRNGKYNGEKHVELRLYKSDGVGVLNRDGKRVYLPPKYYALRLCLFKNRYPQYGDCYKVEPVDIPKEAFVLEEHGSSTLSIVIVSLSCLLIRATLVETTDS